jgi:hypothetical protein
MTAAPLTFVPGQRAADDEPAAPTPLQRAPHDLRQISPDDAVMLPRHIADAAYHVLQAIHALKDNGSHDLFHALGKALDKGKYKPVVNMAPPCEVCRVDVGYGLPHHSQCTSHDALAGRSMPIPQLDPHG